MNKKILAIILIVLGLVASLYLVVRVQETRRGATFTGNTLYFLPETPITNNIGEDVLTNVYLAVGTDQTEKVDAITTKICYGSNLTLATTDVTASHPYTIQRAVVTNGCLDLVVTTNVASALLPTGDAIPIAVLKFRAATNGTGNISFDKTVSYASGLVNGTVQRINIDDVRALTYTIGTGGGVIPPVTCGTNGTLRCSSTWVQTCDGTNWNNTTNCPNGCINGVCNAATPSTGGISFKFSLDGVKPGAMCEANLINKFRVILTNRLSGVNESLMATTATKVNGATTSRGDQVFQLNNLAYTSSKFTGSDNVIRIKSPVHAQMKYCTSGQTVRVSNDSPCSISLGNTVHDFSGYRILAGDVTGGPVAEFAGLGNGDGAINVMDFSYVRSRLNASATPTCNKEGDLNGDGVVNNIDIGLVKSALSYRDDE